jgi:hypothetical protein
MIFDELNRDDLLDIEEFSGFPILSLFEEIEVFLRDGISSIISQFRYNSGSIDSKPFKEMEQIQEKITNAISALSSNREAFSFYCTWVVLEQLEETQSRILTYQNYDIWSRSSTIKQAFSGPIESDYVQRQGESLEDIEKLASSVNPNESWYNLALRNNLREEDYTPQGGTPLKIIFRNVDGLVIRTVVDVIDSAPKVYGRDISKKIRFVEEDLEWLDNEATKKQSIDILLSLKKGDNPNNNLGIDEQAVLGTNKNSLLFPSIFRQLSEIFKSDDSFLGIQVQKINLEQDAVFIDVNILTRANEVETGTLVL